MLRHENAVLRRQLPDPIRYKPADRFWFAVLSKLVQRSRWAATFPVTPGALLDWHRRFIAGKYNYTARRRTGRPPTQAAITPGTRQPRIPQRTFVDRISARPPTVDEAETLNLPDGTPVIRQLRVIYSDNERPVEASVLIKGAHLYELLYRQTAKTEPE